jgi:hypothetical protein
MREISLTERNLIYSSAQQPPVHRHVWFQREVRPGTRVTIDWPFKGRRNEWTYAERLDREFCLLLKLFSMNYVTHRML